VRPVGAQHKADAVALQAKTDLATGYNDEAGQTPFVDKTGQDLGGQNLHPWRLSLLFLGTTDRNAHP
jgi:hypothetical protein